MIDVLFKVLKWSVSVFFFILGLYCLVLARDGQTWLGIMGLFCFAAFFIPFKPGNDTPKDVLFATGFLLPFTAFMALHIHNIPLYPFNAGFFPAWIGYAMIIGSVGMFWIYKRNA
jgi:drug/metabolite transporter (DMT)-like permease